MRDMVVPFVWLTSGDLRPRTSRWWSGLRAAGGEDERCTKQGTGGVEQVDGRVAELSGVMTSNGTRDAVGYVEERDERSHRAAAICRQHPLQGFDAERREYECAAETGDESTGQSDDLGRREPGCCRSISTLPRIFERNGDDVQRRYEAAMYVRFEHERRRLRVCLAYARRIGGRPHRFRLGALGAVVWSEPISVPERIQFWQGLDARLDAVRAHHPGVEIDDVKVRALIADRIPPPSTEAEFRLLSKAILLRDAAALDPGDAAMAQVAERLKALAREAQSQPNRNKEAAE
jgi:hypothetical protein